MARTPTQPGTVGPINLRPLDDSGRPIPAPRAPDGSKLPFPRTVKPAQWTGDTLVADTDGRTYRVRASRLTKGAAETATRRAAMAKLEELRVIREDLALERAVLATGDSHTTVGDLVTVAMRSPGMAKRSPRTRQNYQYSAEQIGRHPIAALLPRDLDVAAVRSFLGQIANQHGRESAIKCRTVLRKAMDFATEDRRLHVGFNPVLVAKDAIPVVRIRETGIDHSRAPTDDQVVELLRALADDPEAGPLLGPRSKSPHGEYRTALVNGLDIADLMQFTFGTGVRIGEASALRWSDLNLEGAEPNASITGTVAYIKGQGTTRQPRTKTAAGKRSVPLSDQVVEMFRRRAEQFGIDLSTLPELPVFPSPQHHDRYRDPNNLSKAVKKLFTKHGLDYARSHVARKWRVTSLLERGVPIGKVADVVGHTRIETTFGYVGRGRSTDPDVRAAL